MQDPDTSGPKDPHTEILKQRSCTSCPTILIQRSRTSAPIGSWYSGPKDLATEILHKCSYRIQMQVVQRIIHTEILKQRSCTSCPTGSWYRYLAQVVLEDPDTVGQKILTEILYKCSYRILIQVVQRILTQRSCTSCPTGSWYRDLAQVRLQDPDTVGQKILLQRSCTSAPTGSLYKRSKGSCTQRSWNRDLAQVGPRGSWYRDLAQVVLEVPDTSSPKASWYEILCKWSYRILIQVVQKDPYTEMIQRSCTSANAGSWYKWPKRSSHRDPETEILHKLSHDLDTEISHKWAYTILIQWAKRSCYRDLAQVLLQDPDTSGPKDHSHRDPETEILHKWSHRILIQRSCTSGPRGSWHKRFESILIRDLVQVVL